MVYTHNHSPPYALEKEALFLSTSFCKQVPNLLHPQLLSPSPASARSAPIIAHLDQHGGLGPGLPALALSACRLSSLQQPEEGCEPGVRCCRLGPQPSGVQASLGVKIQVFLSDPQGPARPAPPFLSLPHSLCSSHAGLQSTQCTRKGPAPGPLHCLYPFPRMLFLQISA